MYEHFWIMQNDWISFLLLCSTLLQTAAKTTDIYYFTVLFIYLYVLKSLFLHISLQKYGHTIHYEHFMPINTDLIVFNDHVVSYVYSMIY